MTSLQDTLPLLDQSVPALPRQVETVRHEAEAFEAAAREAVAEIRARRSAADPLASQVRERLEALRERASESREDVEQGDTTLRAGADDMVQALDLGADALRPAGDRATAAFEALQDALERGVERVGAANDEALHALHSFDDDTREGRRLVEEAAEKLIDAAARAKDSVAAAQLEVRHGVSAVTDAVGLCVARVESRLQQTIARLDALRGDQEQEVSDTLAGLSARCEQVEDAIVARVSAPIADEVQPRLEALEGVLVALGSQVAQIDADCEAGRTELEAPLAAAGERIPPLQASVEQVKRAADQVGLAWA